MKHYYVYILRCSNGSYYVGITNGIKKRLQEHEDGVDTSCYTYKLRPLELVYWERYDYVEQAILREKQLKGWRREKKEALIKGEFNSLKKLSENTRRQAQGDK